MISKINKETCFHCHQQNDETKLFVMRVEIDEGCGVWVIEADKQLCPDCKNIMTSEGYWCVEVTI